MLCVAAEVEDGLWLRVCEHEARGVRAISEQASGEEWLVAQMMGRGAREKLLAGKGQQREAAALAQEGVAIIERTDYFLYLADALADLAEVLRLGGNAAEAASAAERSQRLYEQKG